MTPVKHELALPFVLRRKRRLNYQLVTDKLLLNRKRSPVCTIHDLGLQWQWLVSTHTHTHRRGLGPQRLRWNT